MREAAAPPHKFAEPTQAAAAAASLLRPRRRRLCDVCEIFGPSSRRAARPRDQIAGEAHDVKVRRPRLGAAFDETRAAARL